MKPRERSIRKRLESDVMPSPRDVSYLALCAMDEAETCVGSMAQEFHLRRAEIYARIAQSMRAP